MPKNKTEERKKTKEDAKKRSKRSILRKKYLDNFENKVNIVVVIL